MAIDKRIVTIGTTNGIAVNAYYVSNWCRGELVGGVPVVEICRASTIQMRLPEVEAVIDLLQEALAYWQEERIEQQHGMGEREREHFHRQSV